MQTKSDHKHDGGNWVTVLRWFLGYCCSLNFWPSGHPAWMPPESYHREHWFCFAVSLVLLFSLYQSQCCSPHHRSTISDWGQYAKPHDATDAVEAAIVGSPEGKVSICCNDELWRFIRLLAEPFITHQRSIEAGELIRCRFWRSRCCRFQWWVTRWDEKRLRVVPGFIL